MPAPMTRTRHPGIFKRGSRYVFTYRVNGKQHKESVRTLEQARKLKAARETDRNRGEFQEQSRIPLREYAEEWIDRYQGNGRRGFTDDTRQDYRRDLSRYAYPFFDERRGRTVSGITPRDVADWITWLCNEHQQGRALADATVRRIMSPMRACLATARREGLIRHSPLDGATLPHRPEIDDVEEIVKAFSRDQLRTFLAIVRPEYQLLFRLLAATGLRWGEVAALRWRDLQLDGSRPRVRVRRALGRRRRKGDAPQFKPPKSKYGRREVPLDAALVSQLRRHRSETRWSGDDDLVFAARNGAPLRQENVRRRVLKPAVEEVGAPWAGFHSFRHTCASMLFERGANAVQVQRWLGHHSPAFTLNVYVHLLEDGAGRALNLEEELGAQDAEVIRAEVEVPLAL
ncbi:MAG: site-specific integrase [Solirubrobacterales bacterium]|nr:site-specific integrase [Solirubrobacterales bacterium]